ncbi:unnamed protein product [Adineta ricciae]|uniref:Uncharacterized protein n=1 Tax=Adineta ricciae TaxID=249248 RepID=A0A814A188_ADIRI|nr:unnamed protein product [Adineta ricciae]
MVDIVKRYSIKPWMTQDDPKMIKPHGYYNHLPRLQSTRDPSTKVKQSLPHQCKQHGSAVLPPITRTTSFLPPKSPSPLLALPINLEPIPPIISTTNEPAKRTIRNTVPQPSQELSSSHVTHSAHPKRSTLYGHIQAKINTGLPRTNSVSSSEHDTHQLEPLRPVNWSELKHQLEHDTQIRAHTKRMQFHSSLLYASQLSALGNLVRAKVKTHLLSATGSGDHRYKIVAHLTVFPTTTIGLHVASRCLWNTDTDNSVTIRMQGVDCDILIIVFLCYTDLGAI